MAKEEILARRYAKGLAEVARDEGRVDEIGEELKSLAAFLDENTAEYGTELIDFLNSPIVTPADKYQTIRAILDRAGVSKTTADFLCLLVEKQRAELLPRISRAYSEISGELTGVLTAVVHTAWPLTEEQDRRLVSALSAALGAKVTLHHRVEPGLIAGAKVKIGDRTFDGTVLGKLEAMRHKLIGANPTELS